MKLLYTVNWVCVLVVICALILAWQARPTGQAYKVHQEVPDTTNRTIVAARQKVIGSYLAGLPERNAAIVVGLVTGDESYFTETDVNKFKQAGIAHVVAVSGANFVVFLGICKRFIDHLGANIRLPSLSVLGYLYLAMVGLDNLPALRAYIFLLWQLLPLYLGRKPNQFTIYSFAVSTIIFIEPAAIWSISLQLSLMAWLSIRLFLSSSLGKFSNQSLITTEILSSLLGTLMLLPISLYFFGEVNLLSPLYNMVLVPIFGLIFLISIYTLPLFFTGKYAMLPAVTVINGLSEAIWQILDRAEGIGLTLNSQSNWTPILCCCFISYYLYKLRAAYKNVFATTAMEKLTN